MNEGQPNQNDLLQKLERQKSSFLSEGFVEAKTRIDRIDRSINLLKKNQKDLINAMADDFGHRAHQQSKLADIDGSIGPLENAKKNLKKWMKPEKRKVNQTKLVMDEDDQDQEQEVVLKSKTPQN